MGFFDSFLGMGAAHVIHEMQQDEKDNKRWNDLFNELSDYETVFTNYLESVGVNVFYTFDVEYVNSGNITPEKRKMDAYRKKVDEYISLGGKGEYINDLDELDECIAKIKLLKRNNCLDRQGELLLHSIYDIQEILNNEEKIKNLSSPISHTNDIISVDEEVDLSKNIRFYDVRIWDNEGQQFFDFGANMECSMNQIVFYLEDTTKQIATADLVKDEYTEVTIAELDDPSKKIVRASYVTLVMNTADAYAVEKYYEARDKKIDEIMYERQKDIEKLYQQVEGIDELAKNLLNIVDENILLNHDMVIMMQKLWAYNKIREIAAYDAESTLSDSFLACIAEMKQGIDGMSEIIMETGDFEGEVCTYICWEAIKRASVGYYSDIWRRKYEKYIGEPLKQCNTTEADGTLDSYIEEVIACNEIDNNNQTVLGIFTYYMIEKGYAPGTLYYPAYLDIVIKAFDVIGENVRKNGIKAKLKGGVKKTEVHYTIDDVDMMNGNEFEHFVCELYEKMGYKAEVTKQSCDQGLDVIAEKNGIRIGIQAKCYSNTVGNSAIQEAVAGKEFYKCDKVAVVTNNTYTSSAIELARVNEVILWNRDMLKAKIKELM